MSRKVTLLLGLCLLLLMGIMPCLSTAITLSACGQDLNSSGSYLLNQSITSTATCLTTNSSNVVIDCAGNTITYGTGGGNSAFGINAMHATTSQINLTIRNCILVKQSSSGSAGRGISLTRFANSTIVNNTIRNNGVNGNKGIYVLTGAAGNNISRNTIITSGTSTTNYGIYLAAGTSDSIIEYNNVTTGKGTATTDNYGIRVDDPRATITGNIVYTFGSGDSNHGIYSYTSTGARIVNNTVYTSGTTGNNFGVYLSSSDSNFVANNTINTTGQASSGIYLISSNSPNILNNIINSSADSIYMTSSVLADFTSANITRDNTRFGRNITVYGGGGLNLPCPDNTVIDNPADGGLKFIGCNNITVQNWYRPNRDTDSLLFVNSNNNKIINNTLNGGIHGLIMLNSVAQCDNNLIANNTLSSFGYIDSFAIIIYGDSNTITNNNLSTTGVTSGNIGIEIHGDYNNMTDNLISTAGTSGNRGINFISRAVGNLIQNNTITTSGTSGNTGIYFEDENTGNIIRNNTVIATGTTSGNLGIRLVSSSNNNIIEYNTFYTIGLTSGNNGLDLSSSSDNIFRFNNVYTGYGAGTTDNDAISLVSSRNNTFANNVLFANGTATSITSSAIFLQSNSANNTFVNNVITKSVGNAIELDFLTTYPHGNIFQNNSLNNISGSDLFFLDAGINSTLLMDQTIRKYNFTGAGGTISVENTQFGRIAFTSPISGSNGNFSNDIQIRYNFVHVNSSKQGLNSSANISLYGLPTNFVRPTMLKDEYTCSNCENFTSLNAGNVSFSVLSWSNYSIAEYPNLNSPIISSVSLTTTDSSKNDTNQNLTALWLATDADNDSFFNITDWRINGNSIALLNMPFEGGSSNSTFTKDYSSYGNNGNVSGATLNLTSGYLGGSYFFNADDLITINNGFDYPKGAITFWINERASATSNSMGIFTKLGNPAYMSDIVTAIFSTTVANSALLGFGVYNNNAAAYAWRYDGLNFYNTGWHHVVIQANSSGNEVYIDGQRVSPTYTSGNSSSAGWLDYPAGNTNFRLGCRMGGSSCLYWLDSATIDDFRIYNITLSSQQISAIYKNRTDLIVSQQLAVGQNWSYCLTASDGTRISSTNCSNSVTIFSADTIPPALTIISPLNTTYGSTTIFLNYSVSDSGGVEACWYSRDTSGNISLPGCTTASIVGLADGSHVVRVYVNDTSGNVNSSSVNFVVSSNPPAWSDMQGSVPLVYSSEKSYFNITWISQNSISTVLFESNFSGSDRNYTMHSLGEGVYGFNATLPAGTFYWRSFANDSFGNMNVSSVEEVTIARADNSLILYLNGTVGDLNSSYGNYVNVSATSSVVGDGDIVYTLYRNGNAVGTGKSVSENIVLGVGDYVYNFNSSVGQNYSSAGVSYTLSVNKTIPVLELFINAVGANASQSYGAVSIVNASLSDGLSFSLLRDGVVVDSGSGYLEEQAIFGVGNYNYTASFDGNENYSAVSQSYFLEVLKVNPDLSLLFNGGSAPASISLGTMLEVNASIVSPAGESIDLYEEDNLVDSGVGISYLRNYTTIGERIWKVAYSGNENYSAYNLTGSVAVLDQNVPQYSDLKVSVNSPVTYLSGREYQFNSTWVDNVEMTNVIFSFNGTNHTFVDGQVNQSGNEYYLSLMDLAAGNYSYRWYGADGSGNLVTSPMQQYVVERATANLFLTMIPDFSVGYGTETYVDCSADNPESVVVLNRNGLNVLNPDNATFVVPGVYSYTCSSNISQNYSSANTVGTLIINKGSPVIVLTLNGQSSDINLGVGGGNVVINATLVKPLTGYINITSGGRSLGYGEDSVENTSSFSASGSYGVFAWYYGNANYSSGSVSYNIIVASSSGGGDSGGGSGGRGGSGGGSGGVAKPQFSINISELGSVFMKTGETKKVIINVKNTGKAFANNCKPKLSGKISEFGSVSGSSGLSPGEEKGYSFDINVPAGLESGEYRGEFAVDCDEGSAASDFGVLVYLNPFSVKINSYNRDANLLVVQYNLAEYSGKERNLILNYELIGVDGVTRVKSSEDVLAIAGKNENKEIKIKLPKDSFGEFSLKLKAVEGDLISQSESRVFLPSENGLTGFAVSGDNLKNISIIAIVFLIGGIVFISYRVIAKHRRSVQNRYVGDKLIHLHYI